MFRIQNPESRIQKCPGRVGKLPTTTGLWTLNPIPFSRRSPCLRASVVNLRRCQRGMTLVEVLVAGAILVFGMVGVLAVLGAASRSHKRAIDETLATFVATSVLSEMRAKFAVGVPLKTTQQEEHPDYPGYRT